MVYGKHPVPGRSRDDQNDKVLAEWTQPKEWPGPKDFPGRRIGPGTIALQAHDPNSTVFYKNIRIKVLK
jgi:hypothetical protein